MAESEITPSPTPAHEAASTAAESPVSGTPVSAAAEAAVVDSPATAASETVGVQGEMDAALSASGIGADHQSPPPVDQYATQAFSPPDLEIASNATNEEANIELLNDVTLEVKVELGRTRMFVEDVLRLSNGSVVELDKLAGDPVDIFVNERLVARGEVLVLNDDFCVRISEVVAPNEERKAG